MCLDWIRERVKKLTLTDITLIKFDALLFALLAGKLWTPILNLDWYWYALAWAVVKIIVVTRFYGKGK